ncbi:MAG: hypothetical protein ACYDC2_06195 [Solirubrobacteraceae bacterium]
MTPRSTPPRPRALRPRLAAAAVACAASLAAPAAGQAAVTTFGSPLSVPATMNTTENLSYTGSGIAVPGAVIRIAHDGADTALWNVALPEGAPAAPAAGQVTKFSLEGCAQHPPGAPAPLTQIHFQDLSPLPGGGARVNVTSQPFDIPVCGENGASGSTVTSYAPTNFCVAQGDYVDFNDEGGFVPGPGGGLSPYPSGVPYQVIGAVGGATMNSFVRGGGTNNGATFSPSDNSIHDGFASNPNEELMLQATLATGTDAISSCGGTQLPAGVHKPPAVVYPPLRVSRQTDGINAHRIASIAIYCRPAPGCGGMLTLAAGGFASRARGITKSFRLPGNRTSHLAVRVPNAIVNMARKHRSSGVPMKLTVVIEGKTITGSIVLRIF